GPRPRAPSSLRSARRSAGVDRRMVLPVIRAPFDRPEVLAKLRPAYLAQHHLILPGAAEIKKNFFSFEKFQVANRGRYEVAKGTNSKELQAFAEALTGARL